MLRIFSDIKNEFHEAILASEGRIRVSTSNDGMNIASLHVAVLVRVMNIAPRDITFVTLKADDLIIHLARYLSFEEIKELNIKTVDFFTKDLVSKNLKQIVNFLASHKEDSNEILSANERLAKYLILYQTNTFNKMIGCKYLIINEMNVKASDQLAVLHLLPAKCENTYVLTNRENYLKKYIKVNEKYLSTYYFDQDFQFEALPCIRNSKESLDILSENLRGDDHFLVPSSNGKFRVVISHEKKTSIKAVVDILQSSNNKIVSLLSALKNQSEQIDYSIYTRKPNTVASVQGEKQEPVTHKPKVKVRPADYFIGKTWVEEHKRKDGTFVEGHYRNTIIRSDNSKKQIQSDTPKGFVAIEFVKPKPIKSITVYSAPLFAERCRLIVYGDSMYVQVMDSRKSYPLLSNPIFNDAKASLKTEMVKEGYNIYFKNRFGNSEVGTITLNNNKVLSYSAYRENKRILKFS